MSMLTRTFHSGIPSFFASARISSASGSNRSRTPWPTSRRPLLNVRVAGFFFVLVFISITATSIRRKWLLVFGESRRIQPQQLFGFFAAQVLQLGAGQRLLHISPCGAEQAVGFLLSWENERLFRHKCLIGRGNSFVDSNLGFGVQIALKALNPLLMRDGINLSQDLLQLANTLLQIEGEMLVQDWAGHYVCY